jgi:hypothetical protein
MEINKSAILELFPVTMTDQEIYNAALEEWTGIIAQLWTGIGKPVEQDRLKIYCDQFGKVPLGLLELTINRVMRENTYSNVPPVGVIWQVIRQELSNPYDLNEAIESWPDYVPWINLGI